MIGERFGPYQVLRQIAGGSASRLFLASDGRDVCVVKVFSRHAVARAERELRFGAGLDHPRLNRVDERVSIAGHPAVRMPFVPGVQLSRWLPLHGSPLRRDSLQGETKRAPTQRRTPTHGATTHGTRTDGTRAPVTRPPVPRAPGTGATRTGASDTTADGAAASVADVVQDVLRGLAYLHRRGTVHRDVKPENILVGRDDRGTLIDFDLAAQVGEVLGPRSWAGTAAYLSPERVRGAPAAPADDLYAVGLVLYRGLTGGLPPDEAADGTGVEPTPRWVCAPPLAPLDAWVARALAADPAARFASADEMRLALEATAVPEPQESRSGRAG